MNNCGDNGGCGTHSKVDEVSDSARDDSMEEICKLGL